MHTQLLRAGGPLSSHGDSERNFTFSFPVIEFKREGVKPVPATIETRPAGLGFFVDGLRCTGSYSNRREAGRKHTLAVPNSQLAPDGLTRYTFIAWSDGGAPAHVITSENEEQPLVGSFSTDYRVHVQVNTPQGGWVEIEPESSDEFYASGLTLGVTAHPAAGYVFAGFDGDVDSSALRLEIPVDAPQMIRAIFVPRFR